MVCSAQAVPGWAWPSGGWRNPASTWESPALTKLGASHFALCSLHNIEFWRKPPHQHQWWFGQFSSTQEPSSKNLLFLVCMSAYFDLPKRKGKINNFSTSFSRYTQIFGLNRACNIEMQYIYLVSQSRTLNVLRAMGLWTLPKLLKINSPSLKELLTYIDQHRAEEECLTNNCLTFTLWF